jgi:branched-chain amino acid transport system permease protein
MRIDILKRKGFQLTSLTMAILLIILPFGLSTYSQSLLIQILIYSIFAMSFDLLLGYLGMLSFGHSAFWGLGAYVYGIINSKGYVTCFWGGIGLVITAGLILSAFLGLLVMRTTGVYFAFVNFAFSMLMMNLSYKWKSITNGENGISGIIRPLNLEGLPFYYFVALFFFISFILIYWITHSKYGKTLIGIRENPVRMEALGYNTWVYKYSCYIISGIFGTIAGFLFCSYNRFVSPDDLSFTVTGMALLMVLIGGKANQIGSIIGAFIIVLLFHLISAYTEHWLLVVGIIFVLVVIFAREGVTGYTNRLLNRLGYGSTEG